MKIFTRSFLITLFFFAVISIHAQATLIDVTVSSNVFTPTDITINVGDTVRWTNVQGNHNVNGSQNDFPSNPESFSNSVGSGWVFTHVFTIPGEYDYKCDPHAFLGMTGTVTVEDNVTSLADQQAQVVRSVFPNPAEDFVVFEFGKTISDAGNQAGLVIFDQLGKQHRNIPLNGVNRLEIDLQEMQSGLYIYQVIDGNGVLDAGKFMVR